MPSTGEREEVRGSPGVLCLWSCGFRLSRSPRKGSLEAGEQGAAAPGVRQEEGWQCPLWRGLRRSKRARRKDPGSGPSILPDPDRNLELPAAVGPSFPPAALMSPRTVHSFRAEAWAAGIVQVPEVLWSQRVALTRCDPGQVASSL